MRKKIIAMSAFPILFLIGCAGGQADDRTLVDFNNLQETDAVASQTGTLSAEVDDSAASSVGQSENLEAAGSSAAEEGLDVLLEDLSNYREISYSPGCLMNILNEEGDYLQFENTAVEDELHAILALYVDLLGFQGESEAITYGFAYVNDFPASIRLGDMTEYSYIVRYDAELNHELEIDMDIDPQVLYEGINTLEYYLLIYYPASGDYLYSEISMNFNSLTSRNDSQDNPFIIHEDQLQNKPEYTVIEEGEANPYKNSGYMIYPEKYIGESRLFKNAQGPYHITLNNSCEEENNCVAFVMKEGELLELFEGRVGLAYKASPRIAQRIIDRDDADMHMEDGYNLFNTFVVNLDEVYIEGSATYIKK